MRISGFWCTPLVEFSSPAQHDTVNTMNENTIDSVISIYGVLELSAVSAHCSLPTKFSVFESWLLYVLLSLPERFLLIHHQDGLRTVRRQSSMMSTSAALAAELTETGCP